MLDKLKRIPEIAKEIAGLGRRLDRIENSLGGLRRALGQPAKPFETELAAKDATDPAAIQALARQFVTKPELFKQLCEQMAAGWHDASGSAILHSIKEFSGLPVPYGIDDIRHGIMVSIHNTYEPWLTEPGMKKYFQYVSPYYLTYRKIKDFGDDPVPMKEKERSLVDIYRCWTIWQTLKNLRHLDGDCVEVGVWRGGTSALTVQSLEYFNQSGKLYVCDTFEGVVKAGEKDTAYVGGEHADTSAEVVENLLKNFGPESRYVMCKGIFPEDTGDMVTSDKIKYCHIDVDVYESAKDCVSFLWPRMIKGGIMIFDDYALQGTEGMTVLGNELVEQHDDMMLFHMFNGQGLFIKT